MTTSASRTLNRKISADRLVESRPGMPTHPADVRYRGQSGHTPDIMGCSLLTQSGRQPRRVGFRSSRP